MRKFIKVLAIIGVILLLIWVVLIDPVDYTPYWETPYYAATKSRLEQAQQELTSGTGPLEIGFSKVSITPKIGAIADNSQAGIFIETPMAGYGNREGKPATGVHDSLFVKAVALRAGTETMVLISADMLIMPPNISAGVSEAIQSKIGLDRGQLLFSATHTHSSIGAWSDKWVGEAFGGKLNPAVIQWLIQQISTSIELAVADLQAGQLGWGSFEAPGLIKNRLVGEIGQEDPEFIFIVAEQLAGKKAILGSFGAHATTLGGDNMEFSADYPGYWYQSLEAEAFDMAIFFAGGVGSHSPDMDGKQFDRASKLGKALADSVLKYHAATPLKDSLTLASLSVQLDLAEFHVRISNSQRLAPFISKSLFPPIGDTYVQAARIGDLVWATAPADFSGESARVLKNEMNRQGYKALVSSFNGAYIGYAIPAKYYHLDAYESRVMSWFGPGMGPYTEEMVRRVAEGVIGGE